MKSLRQGIDEYLEYRSRLGFQLTFAKNFLRNFASFMEENQIKHITTEFALAFATINTKAQSISWAKRLGIIRRFAIYWATVDTKTEIPPKNLLSSAYERRNPYIYTDEEILELLNYTDRSENPFDQYVYFILFGLLAVTGMRISEALALNYNNIDLKNGTIMICQSKFRKSRYIPIHQTTVKILKDFNEYRNHYFPHPITSKFLVNHKGVELKKRTVQDAFQRRLKKIGLTKSVEWKNKPKIMGFRHTFAINTLLRWYKQDVASINSHIPLLSTYLGHVKPSNTYWYLSATPELLKLVVSRCKKHKKENKS